MKKQIDFDVRVLTLNAGGVNGGYRHDQMVQWVHLNYPTEQGWEVETVQNIQLSADGVSILLFLVKYDYSEAVFEEMPPEVATEAVAVKRGRGRPKKETPLPEGVVEGA